MLANNKRFPVSIYGYPIVWSDIGPDTALGFIRFNDSFGAHYVPFLKIKPFKAEMNVDDEWIDITYTVNPAMDGIIDFNLLPTKIFNTILDMIYERK